MLKQLNWANSLTIFRILLIPPFAICLIYGYQGLALLTFSLAGVTDGLDGFIARSQGQKTTLGTFLDPTADKLLITTAFLTLAFMGKLPIWLAIVTISRDIIIVTGSSILYMINGHLEIVPTILGKLTTVSQLSTILVTLLANFLAKSLFISEPTIWVTTLITVVSGLHYIYIGTTLINTNGNNYK